jgi:hypothetical protein
MDKKTEPGFAFSDLDSRTKISTLTSLGKKKGKWLLNNILKIILPNVH